MKPGMTFKSVQICYKCFPVGYCTLLDLIENKFSESCGEVMEM